jgi:hypothetical protein
LPSGISKTERDDEQTNVLVSQARLFCPPVNGDFYRIANLLNDTERTVVKRVRDFTEREIAPIIDDYWARTNFLSRSFQSSPRSKSAA